ncbi:restriction endonuclease [Streptomyces sp. SP18CS02]|uniref:restriction endonuclease n=1 Tax=Streptomyces sp. SP18CS02 TaxID=3002531 RepID=UPI003FCC4DAF
MAAAGTRSAPRGGGDLDADVKATDPYGRRWVIQCRHRRDGLAGSAVDTPDLQAVNGTARQVHGADVTVIVTNGRVTAPAVALAELQRLHVVGRHTLAVWASGSRPLWELLRPPVNRPSASGRGTVGGRPRPSDRRRCGSCPTALPRPACRTGETDGI